MEPLDQLQKEWLFINAARELLSIVKNKPGVKYVDVISFAKDLDEELFKDSTSGIDSKDYLEKLYEKYKQEAFARSKESNEQVTPEQVISNRLKEVERLLKQFSKKDKSPLRLKKEARDLEMLLSNDREVVLGLEKVTEHQAIYSDIVATRADKIFVKSHLGKFNEYHDKENGTVFRIAVLHPNPSEGVIGADLIFEQYDEDQKKVRIVAIQYKIWNDNVFYFSQAENLESQLTKISNCFCGEDFCKDSKGGNNLCQQTYRMSYCMAFLKPTDKLQDPKKLITSGHHIPICKINTLKTKTGNGYKLELNAIKNQSVKTNTFEELFDAGMLGSRWLEISELEDFYKKNKVLDTDGRIILYAQGTRKFE